jgi:hypothetical protein
MRIILVLALFLFVGLCPDAQCQTEPAKEQAANEAKGMPPRAAPTDYQVQHKAGAVTIAADFDGHGVPTLEGTYSSEDYVIVEVGIFGEAGSHLKLSIEDFSLKINDKKQPLTSQAFGYVAKSLKDPEWQPPEGEKTEKSKTGINTGGGGGGDNTPPPPPKMPFELRRAMELRVKKGVLPEGDRALPVAGFIFFQYRSKTQSIKQMELIYEGPAGTLSMPMQP